MGKQSKFVRGTSTKYVTSDAGTYIARIGWHASWWFFGFENLRSGKDHSSGRERCNRLLLTGRATVACLGERTHRKEVLAIDKNYNLNYSVNVLILRFSWKKLLFFVWNVMLTKYANHLFSFLKRSTIVKSYWLAHKDRQLLLKHPC